MNTKRPVELLKKKISSEAIMYKFKWSNNSVSIEPMTQLTPDMLVLVHEYELKQCTLDPHEPKPQKHVKSDEKQNWGQVQQPINNGKKIEESKSGKKTAEKPQAEKPQEKEKQAEKQQLQQQVLAQEKADKPEKPEKPEKQQGGAHKPRKSRVCQVKQVRQDNGRVDFLVCFEDSTEQQWVSLEEIKQQAPVAVCDFLLGKVKYGGGQSRK